MQVTFITNPQLLEQKFHLIEPLLLPVVKEAARGEFSVEDIKRMTAEGRVISAVAEKDGEPVMAMAFEFVHYPQILAVNVMALGGHGLDAIADEFWETFRSWCKSAGASVIEASCSNAMARLLGRYGFETVYRVVRAGL